MMPKDIFIRMLMVKINNPILRGFNPDPSICRVGDDYYIATSTFEWFPGVRIYHSTDMVHWTLIATPLNRVSQLDMAGNPDSCGVWAPNLTYADGQFYLVYSNVRRFDGRWKDLANYLVTSRTIDGDWSEPIALNHSGFDASLFHDDDGRKWLLNMVVDDRRGKFFGGIVIQEYDVQRKRLIGERQWIFYGTDLGITEGPNLYKYHGKYYLMTAEGGTERGHAVTLCRSDNLIGPYEVHPHNPILTASDTPDHPLQRTGHASIMCAADGQWYMTYLCGRPIGENSRCVCGRETAIQKVEWHDDDWLYLEDGGHAPALTVDIPCDCEPVDYENAHFVDAFDQGHLESSYQSLREPITSAWCRIYNNESGVRLRGRHSLSSTFQQSMLAQRVTHFNYEATTTLSFTPEHFQQMAGMVLYYNTRHYIYLYVRYDENLSKRVLNVLICDNNRYTDVLETPIVLENDDDIHLRFIVNGTTLQAGYAYEPNTWNDVPVTIDCSICSDEYVCQKDDYMAAFTGAFIGLCCQDSHMQNCWATFRRFEILNKRTK